MLKNANLCIFGPKFTVSAYFELIRQLVHVPHRTSIALWVFTMILTDRKMVVSPLKTFFYRVDYLQKFEFAHFRPQHHSFCQLWAFGTANRNPSWDIHNFLSLLYHLNCWSSGNKPPKEVFFQSWLHSWHHSFGQLWALGEAIKNPSWDIHNFLSLLYNLNYWINKNKPPKEMFFQSWLPWKMPICAILVPKSLFRPTSSSLGS